MMMNRAELELRRLAAVQDIKAGTPGGVMVERYKISRTTLTRWRRAVENGRSLAATKAPGRPRRLTPHQEALIAELFHLGPLACAFDVDRWTQDLFACAIQDATGVEYSGDHVGRIMHRLGLR